MFETPLYSSINNDILNTHIAYGIAECLMREEIEDVYIYPVGLKYYITPENEYALIEGLKSALDDMLALHFALSKCQLIKVKGGKKQVTVSNVSFCNGAFLDPPQNTQAYPRILQKIQELTKIDPKKLKERKIKKDLKPPLSLDPTLGSYMGFYSVNEYESISVLDYALAWVGFHFYSVFVNTGNYLYILCFKPLSKLDCIDILSLKDFATKTKITKSMGYINGSAGYKYIVLRFFAEINGFYPMIFEENKMTPKSLRLIVYGIEKTKTTKGYRIYDYVNITKIWNFMTLLKIKDLENYKYLLKILLSQKNNELRMISELLYNTIVYENVDSAYSLIRYLKIALKESVPHSFVETVIEYLKL